MELRLQGTEAATPLPAPPTVPDDAGGSTRCVAQWTGSCHVAALAKTEVDILGAQRSGRLRTCLKP